MKESNVVSSVSEPTLCALWPRGRAGLCAAGDRGMSGSERSRRLRRLDGWQTGAPGSSGGQEAADTNGDEW